MYFCAQMPKYGNLGLDPLRMMIFHQVMIFFLQYFQFWAHCGAGCLFKHGRLFEPLQYWFSRTIALFRHENSLDKIKELCHHWDKEHYVPVWGVWVLEALGMVREETFHWPFVGIFWDFKCEDCYMFSPDKDNDVVKNIIRRISLFKKYINLL